MKQIVETNFPYPVLLEDGGDFNNSSFRVDIDFKIDNNRMLLAAKMDLKCDFIKKLIENNEAVIFINIEQKLFRKSIMLNKLLNSPFDLSEAIELNRLAPGFNIEIMPMIIASKDIEFDYDESMDYRFGLFGDSFKCTKGSILGYGNLNIFELPNENKISSIFTLSKMDASDVVNGVPYKIDFSGDVIDIKVIPVIFDSFINTKSAEPTYSRMLNSVFVYPVVQLAIVHMFKDYEECSKYKWCIAVGNKISSVKKDTIDNLRVCELTIDDIIEYTNIVLGDLLEDSFAILQGDEE